MKRTLVAALVLTAVYPAAAQGVSSDIRLDQIGFYPDRPKLAVVVDAPAGPFYLTTPDGADTLFTGTLSERQVWGYSGEEVRRADFTAFAEPGEYVLAIPDVGRSAPFRIEPFVHQPVVQALIKGYYFQRASTSLHPRYADRWARGMGHPDDRVLVHPSAAGTTRPAGTVVAAPKGWYDAGDFNKYVVNAGISTYTLLALYEHFPDYFDALSTNIPESVNALPDLLDEVLWNLRWMLAMQDPADGGVYHKLTTADFEGVMMPNEAHRTRYVVQKSTAAALDLTAVAAQAARVFSRFEDAVPGLADSCLAAAQQAWRWAQRNPDVVYDQNQLNRDFDPDIHTGEYGDHDFDDEFRWAAAELYVTTRQDSFVTAHDPLGVPEAGVPAWPSVGTLGLYTLAHHRETLTPAVDGEAVEALLVALADRLLDTQRTSAYRVPMGNSTGDFVWGSNAVAANEGMALVQAYRLTGDDDYFEAALAALDYLLGRNATGYSFVTGVGRRTPMHPHHRQSEADNVLEPVPGLLVGGPNPGQEDGCDYTSGLPARSYTDSFCSYASNEIAINWNAPAAYLAGAIEAITSPDGQPVSIGALPSAVPTEHILGRNYPNPFDASTTIPLQFSRPTRVALTIYDVLGREVYRVPERVYPPGRSAVTWYAMGIAAGLYLVQLQGEVWSGSMTVVHTR